MFSQILVIFITVCFSFCISFVLFCCISNPPPEISPPGRAPAMGSFKSSEGPVCSSPGTWPQAPRSPAAEWSPQICLSDTMTQRSWYHAVLRLLLMCFCPLLFCEDTWSPNFEVKVVPGFSVFILVSLLLQGDSETSQKYASTAAAIFPEWSCWMSDHATSQKSWKWLPVSFKVEAKVFRVIQGPVVSMPPPYFLLPWSFFLALSPPATWLPCSSLNRPDVFPSLHLSSRSYLCLDHSSLRKELS